MSHFDVIIVGAGLSGIGAACHLIDRCPGKSYAILDGRNAIGGTWDLFRYPGVRSDSDMHTLGYNFKPWRDAKAIADGPAICRYVEETAAEHGVDGHIRFGHRVESAAWSSADCRWRVTARLNSGDAAMFTCNVLSMCSGYYSYERGHTPEFSGIEDYRGIVVHPQDWPDDLDYAGKRVIVIGSGATAMTLVPAMASRAAHVTMVQRSPTYVVSMPDTDAIANALRKLLPERLAYAITRFKNTTLQRFFYRRTRTDPEWVKRKLLDQVRKALGDQYDVETHFTPRYNPCDQRLCLIPNADLFDAIRSNRASVVTERVARFTRDGIELESGETLDADIVVTATGLELVMLGGLQFTVDGEPVDFSRTFTYKGMMYSDVPNLVQTFGYINASWTLRADLTSEYVCRLINHMDGVGARRCTPRLAQVDRNMRARPWIEDFSPGYMQRVMHLFPKQGDHDPWRNTQDYALDRKIVRRSPLEDGRLIFDDPASARPTRPVQGVPDEASDAA